jgi:exosortase K
MQLRFDQHLRQSLFWWLPVITAALLLKQHYSVADTNQLQWILQPLADMLSLFTGHDFQRSATGEWYSISANVSLVKACAGVNFMLMSLLAYAWMFRPDRNEEPQTLLWSFTQLLLLAAVFIAAWATTLMANTLRIWLAMYLQADDSILHSSGIEDRQLHRFIGIAVYLLILSLQMLPSKRIARWQKVLTPVILYLLLMVLVPLLTGNALHQPTFFFEHVSQLLLSVVVIQGIWYLVMLRGNRPRDL